MTFIDQLSKQSFQISGLMTNLMEIDSNVARKHEFPTLFVLGTA